MGGLIAGLHAVTLHIRDVDGARTFYRDVLGFKELRFDAEGRRIVFALPGTSTLLTMHVPPASEKGRPPGTVSGLVFHSSDPTETCREVKRRGGTVTAEPETQERHGRKFVRGVIADPDGNEFIVSNRWD